MTDRPAITADDMRPKRQPDAASRRTRDYTAPPGHIWVCRYCGKRARNRLRDDNPLWDESCAANAVLCREDDLPS
jgi:hypothetical protein